MQDIQKMLSKLLNIRNLLHELLTRRHTPEHLRELLGEIPRALNLETLQDAIEGTLEYDAEDPAPSLSIIPIEKILSLPWQAGEYHAEDISPPPYEDLSTASTCTITSDCAGNPQWECKRLAAFLLARNKAYDDSSTGVVVLARSHDPWELEENNLNHAVLVQIVGSLITEFARYIPDGVLPAISSIASKISRFNARRDLDDGLAVLSTLPPLDLNGKSLFLIIDLSDFDVSENGQSRDYRNLGRALVGVAVLNRAILIRMEDTKTGWGCFIYGPGEINQNGSSDLQILYDPTKGEQ